MAESGLSGLLVGVLLAAGTFHVSREVFGSDPSLVVGLALIAAAVYLSGDA